MTLNKPMWAAIVTDDNGKHITSWASTRSRIRLIMNNRKALSMEVGKYKIKQVKVVEI